MTVTAEAPAVAGEPPAEPSGRARLRRYASRHGWAVAGAVALAIGYFFPVWAHLRTRILSDGQDGASFLWSMWAVPKAILSFHNPFVTSGMFYPVGARTAFHTNIPLEAIASWPLARLFGLPMAANLIQLASVVLSAVGAYLLALHESGDRRAAFVAGAAFTFVPYRFAQISGHFNLAHTEFIPFGLLALLLLYERRTRKQAVWFGVVLGLTFLTDLYYTVFLILAVLVVAAWRWRATFTREMGRRLGLASGVAVLIASPLLLNMARDLLLYHYSDPLPGWGLADAYSADLLSWFVPSSSHPIWGSAIAEINRAATSGERIAFPGYLVLGLGVAGMIWGVRKRRAVWATVFGVFFLLSLGPYLHVYKHTGGYFHYLGAIFSVPLPYFLFHFIPVINGVRVPGRFSIVGILALDVLAAMALARLFRGGRRAAWGMAAAALALVCFEFLPGAVATQPAAIPTPYSAIAASPDRSAVMELPVQWRTGFESIGDPTTADHTIDLYYATAYDRPLVSGMVARYPARKVTELEPFPLYRQVLELQGNQEFKDPVTFTAGDLRSRGIGFVVYHRDLTTPPPLLAYFETLGLPHLADDGTVLVWKVP